MTILLKKCTAFACDRTVSDLRWTLGYRTCPHHAGGRASVTGTDRWRGRSPRAERPRDVESWDIGSDRARVADVIGAVDNVCGHA